VPDKPNSRLLNLDLSNVPSAPDGEDEQPTNENPSLVKDDERRERVKSLASDRAMRESYADKACYIVVGCLWGWAVFLLFAGWTKYYDQPVFSDQTIAVVTTGVTLNIFAALLTVIRGLFPTAKSEPAKSNRAKKTAKKGKRRA